MVAVTNHLGICKNVNIYVKCSYSLKMSISCHPTYCSSEWPTDKVFIGFNIFDMFYI